MLQKISLLVIILLGVLAWIIINQGEKTTDKDIESLEMSSTEEKSRVDSFYVVRDSIRQKRDLEYSNIKSLSADSSLKLLIDNLQGYEKNLNNPSSYSGTPVR